MVVNSFSFLLFFVVVFALYYLPIFGKTPKYQNWVLLISSYFFYAYADWRMLPLLFGSTVVFYFLGLWLKKKIDEEKWNSVTWIKVLGVVLGVGILGYFKYFNFFADSIAQLLTKCGLNVSWTALNIIIPIGVSFFTFRLLSYILEVSNEEIEPTNRFVDFAVYISFFPTILSGPIDRAKKFIPQLRSVRKFDYNLAIDGCRQILWGVFIKMCIADNLASITDSAWANYQNENGSTLLVIALLYFIQLYADFDGYSHMAIGVGKILNIKITRNFDHPLLSRNVADFWRRWHISLSTWITDYVYTPLNYSFRNLGKLGVILAVMINLFVIGLWHGANWTYILFGVYHGLLFIPLILLGKFGKNKKMEATKLGFPKLKDFGSIILTYFLISFGLIIFRADNVQAAIGYISSMFGQGLLIMPSLNGLRITVIVSLVVLCVLEWTQRSKEHPLQYSGVFNNKWISYFVDVLILIAIVYCGNVESNQFIYFQF